MPRDFYIGVILAATIAWPTYAVGSCVRFDVADTVGCIEVMTDSEKDVRHSAYQRVQLELDISAFVQFKRSSDLAQFVYIIELPERRGRIVDYSPKTELVSDVAGTTSVSSQSESNSSLGLNANTDLGGYGTASFNASNGGRETDTIKFERKPHKQLLAASGTLDRGSAVYFKLKPSSQTTLEGSRRITIVLEIPKSWRSDYLRVRCVAYSVGREAAESKRPICGSMAFLVGLHRQGDHLGFELAQELVASERRLRRVAASYEDQILDDADSDFSDLLLAAFKKKTKRRVPEKWVDAIVHDRLVSRTHPFERHLPDEVREAISSFRMARLELSHN